MTGTATAPDQVAAARLAPVVTEVVDIRRQIAQLQAREARALAHAGEIADAWAAAEENMSTADLPRRSVSAELATALRVSDRTVQRQIGEAERMVEMFPETVRSLGAGRISLAHARVIVEAGDRIEHPELAAEYENSVLGYAEAESASRLRPIARRRAQWFLNETIRERHAKAAATRSGPRSRRRHGRTAGDGAGRDHPRRPRPPHPHGSRCRRGRCRGHPQCP